MNCDVEFKVKGKGTMREGTWHGALLIMTISSRQQCVQIHSSPLLTLLPYLSIPGRGGAASIFLLLQ